MEDIFYVTKKFGEDWHVLICEKGFLSYNTTLSQLPSNLWFGFQHLRLIEIRSLECEGEGVHGIWSGWATKIKWGVSFDMKVCGNLFWTSSLLPNASSFLLHFMSMPKSVRDQTGKKKKRERRRKEEGFFFSSWWSGSDPVGSMRKSSRTDLLLQDLEEEI